MYVCVFTICCVEKKIYMNVYILLFLQPGGIIIDKTLFVYYGWVLTIKQNLFVQGFLFLTIVESRLVV